MLLTIHLYGINIYNTGGSCGSKLVHFANDSNKSKITVDLSKYLLVLYLIVSLITVNH